MTKLGKLITFFPIAILCLMVTITIWFIREPGIYSAAALVFVIYGVPVICFRMHQAFFPIKEKLSDITTGYSPWYGAHMIQLIFITFPVFERVLRLVPGAFSFWLRLWGSKIGKNVYWTPHLEILDRSLLEIGNDCVFGHNVGLSSHLVRPSKRYGLTLYVKSIKLEKGVFLAADVRIGPGVMMEQGTVVPPGMVVFPNTALKGKVKPTNNEGPSVKRGDPS